MNGRGPCLQRFQPIVLLDTLWRLANTWRSSIDHIDYLSVRPSFAWWVRFHHWTWHCWNMNHMERWAFCKVCGGAIVLYSHLNAPFAVSEERGRSLLSSQAMLQREKTCSVMSFRMMSCHRTHACTHLSVYFKKAELSLAHIPWHGKVERGNCEHWKGRSSVYFSWIYFTLPIVMIIMILWLSYTHATS